MNNDIKEIIDKLKNIEDYLSFSEAKQIKDYITNLQEENERLYKELEKADSITQSCIFEGSRSAGKSYRQCLNWLEDYKSKNEKLQKEVEKLQRENNVLRSLVPNNEEFYFGVR